MTSCVVDSDWYATTCRLLIFRRCFFVQPFVRYVIRRLFAGNIAQRNEQNSNKTVKPSDETEAIADVIIREDEIEATD